MHHEWPPVFFYLFILFCNEGMFYESLEIFLYSDDRDLGSATSKKRKSEAVDDTTHSSSCAKPELSSVKTAKKRLKTENKSVPETESTEKGEYQIQ